VCPKDDLMNIVNYSKNSLMITVFLRLVLVPGLLIMILLRHGISGRDGDNREDMSN